MKHCIFAARLAYLQNLEAALLISQANLHLDFQPTRSEQGLIQHVLPVHRRLSVKQSKAVVQSAMHSPMMLQCDTPCEAR